MGWVPILAVKKIRCLCGFNRVPAGYGTSSKSFRNLASVAHTSLKTTAWFWPHVGNEPEPLHWEVHHVSHVLSHVKTMKDTTSPMKEVQRLLAC
jgi:hypothetical protein